MRALPAGEADDQGELFPNGRSLHGSSGSIPQSRGEPIRNPQSAIRRLASSEHSVRMLPMSPFSRRRFLQVTTSTLLLARPCEIFAADAAATPAPNWTPLFDGKTMKGWKLTDFGGHGEVKVEDGRIVLGAGNDITGVNYTSDVPKMNYEVELEASRIDGSDFFCGLTIPYGDAFCTFVVGGWGGTLVGLSSINGDDASENETTQFKKFETGHWYRVRVRMTPEKIEAWLDNEQMVNVSTKGKKISMRPGEIELSEPFGIASYRTDAALRDIKIRKL